MASRNKAGAFLREALRPSYFFGALTLLAALITTYTFAFPDHPELSHTVASETNVLDVHKPLQKLSILYDGQDIRQRHLNLKIIQLRVENTGDVNILKNHFDQDLIWGLRVDSGRVLDEPRLIETNSRYLREHISPHRIPADSIYHDSVLVTVFNIDSLIRRGACGEGTRDIVLCGDIVEFNQCILEERKFFTVEILVLHRTVCPPVITPIGKIAGIDSLVLTERKDQAEPPSFLAQLLMGGPLVHIVRFSAYILVVVISIWIIVSISSGVAGRREKRQQQTRQVLFREVMSESPFSHEAFRSHVEVLYVQHGLIGLFELREALDNSGVAFRRSLIERVAMHRSRFDDIESEPYHLTFSDTTELVARIDSTLKTLEEQKLAVVNEAGRLAVKPEIIANLDAAIELLREREKVIDSNRLHKAHVPNA